jgi:two-component sensor histidine kinase
MPMDSRAAPPVTLQLSPGPLAPRIARDVVRQALADLDRTTVDKVTLLTSEIVTNAVVHAATPVTVTIERDEARVRVVAEDADEALPAPRQSPSERGGFGLQIVSDLADDWGAETQPGGKRVWFEVRLASAGHALERGTRRRVAAH